MERLGVAKSSERERRVAGIVAVVRRRAHAAGREVRVRRGAAAVGENVLQQHRVASRGVTDELRRRRAAARGIEALALRAAQIRGVPPAASRAELERRIPGRALEVAHTAAASKRSLVTESLKTVRARQEMPGRTRNNSRLPDSNLRQALDKCRPNKPAGRHQENRRSLTARKIG